MSERPAWQRWVVMAGAIGVTGLLPTAGSAQPPQRGGEGGRGMFRLPLMVALDVDGDGALSPDEIAKASERLRSLDRNSDGQVDAEELRPAGFPGGPFGRPAPDGSELVEQLMAFDKNADSVLTVEEVPARMRAIVERADVDGDGKATREELLTAARAAAAAGAGREGGRERFPRGEGGGENGTEERRPRFDG